MFSSDDSVSSFISCCNEPFPLTHSPINGSFQLKFSPLKNVLKTPEYLKSSDSLTACFIDAEIDDDKISLTPLINVFSPEGTFGSFSSIETPIYCTDSSITKPDTKRDVKKIKLKFLL